MLKLPKNYEELSYLTDTGKPAYKFADSPDVSLTCSYEEWPLAIPQGYRTKPGDMLRCMTYLLYDVPALRYYENGFIMVLCANSHLLSELVPDVPMLMEQDHYTNKWRFRMRYQEDLFVEFASFPVDFWASWDKMNTYRKRMLV